MNIGSHELLSGSEALPPITKRNVIDVRTSLPTLQTAKLSQSILGSYNMTPVNYEMLEICSFASYSIGTLIVITGIAASINSHIHKLGSLGAAVAVGHGLMFLGISYGIDRGLLRCESSCKPVPLFDRINLFFQISRKNFEVLNTLAKRTYALSAVLSLASLASYCTYKDNIYSAQVNAISMLSSFLALGMAIGTDLSLLNMESCAYKDQT